MNRKFTFVFFFVERKQTVTFLSGHIFDILYFFLPFQSEQHRNTLTEEGIELVLTVMEAKELIGPSDTEQFDTFVRIYMIPEREETPAQHTKVSNIDNSFHFISFPLHFITA